MRAKSLTLGKLYFCGLLVELTVIKIIVLENYVMIWEVLLKCVCVVCFQIHLYVVTGRQEEGKQNINSNCPFGDHKSFYYP